MRKGKMVAQGAHASILSVASYIAMSRDVILIAPEEIAEWILSGMTKICVRGDSEEHLLALKKACNEAEIYSHMVIDAGNTEFHGVLTKTCLAIGPDLNEKIDSITKDLKLL